MSTVALQASVNPPSRQVLLLLALECSGALSIEYSMLLHNDFFNGKKNIQISSENIRKMGIHVQFVSSYSCMRCLPSCDKKKNSSPTLIQNSASVLNLIVFLSHTYVLLYCCYREVGKTDFFYNINTYPPKLSVFNSHYLSEQVILWLSRFGV